jgi:hypothetical protein
VATFYGLATFTTINPATRAGILPAIVSLLLLVAAVAQAVYLAER